MNYLEQQVEALMHFCTAEKESDRRQARKELRFLLEGGKNGPRDPEQIVRRILLELGAPDHLSGHPMVVEGILMVVENRTYINSMTFGLYPQLAVKFDTTASRVERAIRNLIEVTWNRGDMDILCRYFGSTVSPDRGKPTNSEFIARIANIVKEEVKE